MSRTAYDNFKAIAYAKAWCGKESNACGVFLKGENLSDCAHFLAHCLSAGGIVIKDTSGKLCPHGLAVRNVDLVAGLNKLAQSYENVFAIELGDAIVGDVGFLKIERPRHAFMVCEPWNSFGDPLGTPKVHAHSGARCCEVMDTFWRQWLSDAFRLEDG